jgi:hypothetical protein
MKTFEDFCEAIKMRESGGDYTCENKFGYLGAYQFGMARLCDLGFTLRKDPVSKGMDNSCFVFIPVLDKALFLNDQVLQDCLFFVHIKRLKNQVLKLASDLVFSFGSTYNGKPISLSGVIAMAHLNGAGSVVNLFKYGKDDNDGLGTCSSEYLINFSGYELP